VTTLLSWAQQDPHFSQYMLNKSYWSPALTSLDGVGSVSLISRAQWVGYEATFDQNGSPPSTQFLNFSSPLSIKGKPFGIGVNVIYDKLGVMSNLETQLSLAYHKSLNRGTLSFGVRPSFINQTLDFGSLRFVEEDPNFPNTKETRTAFDLGGGLGYSTENYTLAVGVNHLLRPSFNYGDEDNPINIIYNLYAEYNYILTYNINLAPSLLVKSDLNVVAVDVSLIATYNKKLSGGFSYRNAESIVLIMGYSLMDNDQLKVGYAFDYIISERSAKQPTSHEIFIKYNLPSINTGAKKIIRTPRFRH
jgi:type IX secretion system PorP/SprF family membrane protein